MKLKILERMGLGRKKRSLADSGKGSLSVEVAS